MKKNYFTEKLNKGLIAFTLVFCAFMTSSVVAQKNIAWTGATNNNWSTASNWNYPAITSAATFANNAAFITLNAANTEIAVGDKVSGFGIPVGATITLIEGTKITLSSNTIGAVPAPGTNIAFTFASPKVATSSPTIVDIALIANGGNPTLSAGSYFIGGLTISNDNVAGNPSTLTIPSGVELIVETLTNEGVLVKGGNIVNDGYLEIISSLSPAAGVGNNFSGAYGMTFSLPAVVPTVATEYTYSGTGELIIDTSLGNNNSGAFLLNGFGTNGNNATYKLLFNGTTSIKLSTVKATNGTANTHVFRYHGNGTFAPCKVILGGAGFDLGDPVSGGLNGLMSFSGPGLNVTVAPETTFNVYCNEALPSGVIGFYAYAGGLTPSNFINKGTIKITGTGTRSAISLSSEYGAIQNFINEGTVEVDMKYSTGGTQAGFFVAGYQAPTVNTSECNLINSGTMSITSPLNNSSAGYAIYSYTDGNKSPFMTITNSGTLNLKAANFSTGGRAFNPASPTSTGSKLINSGTLNSDQDLRGFYTENTSTGILNFASNPNNTIKLVTFTGVLATAVASIGTTYTDQYSNIHTVVVAKAGTGTTLVTHVNADIVNPPTTPDAINPQPIVLTKTGDGAGDATIAFTGHTTNNDNLFYQRTLNSGVLNTNAGTRAMTIINGVTTPSSTSVLSPGGDTGKSIATFGEAELDAFSLKGTIKMQISGNTTAGVDYDKIVFPGKSDVIDISEATLDVTGIYTPSSDVTVDILTTYVDPVDPLSTNSGALLNGGPFANVIGLTSGWKVNYVDIIGGKVQLSFDPNLSTSDNAFSKFKFNYYPNPTSNLVNLSAEKNISKVELYTITGQKVQSNTVNASQKQLNISNLQRGVYLMEVSIDNAKKTFKIVKQ